MLGRDDVDSGDRVVVVIDESGWDEVDGDRNSYAGEVIRVAEHSIVVESDEPVADRIEIGLVDGRPAGASHIVRRGGWVLGGGEVLDFRLED